MVKGRKKRYDANKRLRGTDQPCRMDYVENGDTLMYAINYANNAGYVLIGATILAKKRNSQEGFFWEHLTPMDQVDTFGSVMDTMNKHIL